MSAVPSVPGVSGLPESSVRVLSSVSEQDELHESDADETNSLRISVLKY